MSNEDLAAFCREHGILELAVFGSAARGELRDDSDIDVVVTFATGVRWDLYDYAGMREELERLFARPVDLIESGTITNPYRRQTIERDLTVLYAA